MMHWTAKRILPSLLDETLERKTELDLRDHVASCASCRHALRDYEQAESLLQRLPATLMPIEYNHASYGRLVSLSRWDNDPAIATPDRWRAPLLTVASLAALLVIAMTGGHWSPIIGPGSAGSMMPAVQADYDLLPTTLTIARH